MKKTRQTGNSILFALKSSEIKTMRFLIQIIAIAMEWGTFIYTL